MNEKLKEVAATLGDNRELVDELERRLREPGDRAYLVCEYLDCHNNVKGRCTIHIVTNPPERPGNGPCASYTA
jgi:hypothetical protein